MPSDTGARMRVAWLRQHAEKIDDAPDTLCRYRRELERLLFRCRVKRGTSPSSPRVEDREAYEAFLASPSAALYELCEPHAACAEGARWATSRWRSTTSGTRSARFGTRSTGRCGFHVWPAMLGRALLQTPSVFMTVGRCRQCIDAAKLHAAHLGEW
ncbi:hypothetical protein [Burkholderia plantarii]|uniref:hypothetical protein n=1 Tax=Burkholderia plantarii TaxID=41899 RepID=UPI000A550F44|nr:hypothetical protein [Burkholderia plantarii]